MRAPTRSVRERVLETLDRVVRMEMVADVPLGAFLSGGVDSSSIVALMNRHRDGRRISTYTVGIAAEDLRYDIIPDDTRWSRTVARLLDTDYHEITLKPAGGVAAAVLPSRCRSLNGFSSYLVSRQAREELQSCSPDGRRRGIRRYPRNSPCNSRPHPVRAPPTPVMRTIATPARRRGGRAHARAQHEEVRPQRRARLEDPTFGYALTSRTIKNTRLSDATREATHNMDATFSTATLPAPPRRAAQSCLRRLKTFSRASHRHTEKTSMAATSSGVRFCHPGSVELAARSAPVEAEG